MPSELRWWTPLTVEHVSNERNPLGYSGCRTTRLTTRPECDIDPRAAGHGMTRCR
jgi:hypothetical protein